jgi:energy-coupling factor transporter ATP-binding protein EcfA2
MLPFPSTLDIPFQRFDVTTQDNVNWFQYMGRSRFAELHKMTRGRHFLAGFEKIYLYGSSGSGKSHLLAALACQLIREGARVVYIPDCGDLLYDFAEVIQNALRCAFFDSPLLVNIESALSIDALVEFWKAQEDYFIIDQLNALELGGRTHALDEKKKEVTGWLNKMILHHQYIFSASANETSNQLADMKQSKITVFRINGGMTEVRRHLNTAL